MILLQLFLTDEVNGGIVLVKIIGHGFDLFFDSGRIRPFFQYHKTLSRMFLPGGKLRVFSVSHRFQRAFHRNGILSGILHARNPADGVGMALAYALAPECIIVSLRKNGIGIHSV